MTTLQTTRLSELRWQSWVLNLPLQCLRRSKPHRSRCFRAVSRAPGHVSDAAFANAAGVLSYNVGRRKRKAFKPAPSIQAAASRDLNAAIPP